MALVRNKHGGKDSQAFQEMKYPQDSQGKAFLAMDTRLQKKEHTVTASQILGGKRTSFCFTLRVF